MLLNRLESSEDLKQRAYTALKQAILEGRLRQGILYKEIPLAAQLGVSRTPVREALLRLSAEGLVRYVPRRGVTIVRPTADDVLHFFQLRQALESFAMASVASRGDPELVKDLEEIIAEQSRHCEVGDWPAYMATAARFHVRMIAALGNPRFDEVFLRLTEQLQQFGLEAISARREARDLLREHRQIVRLIRARDGEQAARLVIAHAQTTADVIAESRRSGGEVISLGAT